MKLMDRFICSLGSSWDLDFSHVRPNAQTSSALDLLANATWLEKSVELLLHNDGSIDRTDLLIKLLRCVCYIAIISQVDMVAIANAAEAKLSQRDKPINLQMATAAHYMSVHALRVLNRHTTYNHLLTITDMLQQFMDAYVAYLDRAELCVDMLISKAIFNNSFKPKG